MKAENLSAIPIDDDLSKKDFIRLMCKYAGSKEPKNGAIWLEALIEVMIREIDIKGSVNVPYLGRFVGVKTASRLSTIVIDGEPKVVRIPERLTPMFRPCADFIDDINGKGVSGKYQKRKLRGRLTQRDWYRQIRADEGLTVGYINEEKIEKAKSAFLKKIQKRTEEVEKQNELIKDEPKHAGRKKTYEHLLALKEKKADERTDD